MTILDGTFGGGGHSTRLLNAGASVIAIDRDKDAIAQAAPLQAAFPDRFRIFHARFDQFPEILQREAIGPLHGILLDIGVSSHQFDDASRGFSIRFNGPLDMRMDQSDAISAASIVNSWPESDIADTLYRLGEEHASRRIAAAIVRHRDSQPFSTTTELADVIASVVRKKGAQHPAVKSFQALRIAVNDELGCLQRALAAAPPCLLPNGRIAVITFHSLEDRIVKLWMRHLSEPETDRPEWPAPRPNPDLCLSLPSRRAISPSPAELAANPRSRSARLRVAERLPSA
jgi:16S rRNA (cytosine1402-N4)-methyltransferase